MNHFRFRICLENVFLIQHKRTYHDPAGRSKCRRYSSRSRMHSLKKCLLEEVIAKSVGARVPQQLSGVQILLQFNVLQFLGLDLGTVIVYLSLPVAFCVTVFISPIVADAVPESSDSLLFLGASAAFCQRRNILKQE